MDPMLKIVIALLSVAGALLVLMIIISIPSILAAFIKSDFWFNTRQVILETIDGYRGMLFGCKCEDCCWNTQPDYCFQNMPGIKKEKPYCPKFDKRRK